MPLVERLEEAAKTLEELVEKMRSSIRPAESLAEVKANNVVYNIAELIEEIARSMKKLHCISQAVKASDERVVPVCTSWRLYTDGDAIILLRIKPETVIRFDGNSLFFQRDHLRFKVTGTTVKLCRYNYCKEFNAVNRSEVVSNLQRILYILRFVGNAVRKSSESITLCARKEAPECARIY